MNTSAIKCLIVDDEPDARAALHTLVQLMSKELHCVGQASSVAEARTQIQTLQPHLVFLDIDLGDGTAFDLLASLNPIRFGIIFVTGHADKAIEAFRMNALHYIQKPIDPELFFEAVGQAMHKLDLQNLKIQLNNLLSNRNQSQAKRLVLHTGDDIHLLEFDQIIRCESDGNYTSFFTSTAQSILVSKPIKHYEDILEKQGFFRCHQSHMINLKYLAKYHKKAGGFAILTDGSQIPVATRKKNELIERLEEL